jgi:hypothetical protein
MYTSDTVASFARKRKYVYSWCGGIVCVPGNAFIMLTLVGWVVFAQSYRATQGCTPCLMRQCTFMVMGEIHI